MACGTPFERKRPNPQGYLAASLAVTPYFALRKMFPGRVWYPLVGQLGMRIGTSPLLRKAWACGTPFEPKRTNPHGYLAARLAVKPYFALRKMLPGRVWQPLVGQPAMWIHKYLLLRKAWCIMCLVGHLLNQKEQIRIGILQQVCLSEHAPCFAKGLQGGSGGLL